MPTLSIKLSLPLLVLMLAGCAGGAGRRAEVRDERGHATGLVSFSDEKHGLQLSYPVSWQEQGFLRPRGAVLVLMPGEGSRGRFPSTVSVVAQPPPRDGAAASDLLQMEARLVERGRRQIGDFQIVESTDDTLGGEPARRVICTGSKLGMRMQVMNLLSARNGRGYALAYAAAPEQFDARLAEVQTMIDSWQWTR
jgi:hypothetical protein